MPEKFFDQSFAFVLVAMFLVCSVVYNIGYFGVLGDTFWYFLYLPITFSDIIKTGFAMLVPLIGFLLIFKMIVINPVFLRKFPGARILLIVAVLVLVSNLLYFTIFINSPNRNYELISEVFFYISSLLCLLAIIYYFSSESSQQFLLIVFFLSLIPISLLLGSIDAKITVNSTLKSAKSQILFNNDKVVSANILRSFDKGLFLMINNTNSINFVSWDEVKEVKFKKVSGL